MYKHRQKSESRPGSGSSGRSSQVSNASRPSSQANSQADGVRKLSSVEISTAASPVEQRSLVSQQAEERHSPLRPSKQAAATEVDKQITVPKVSKEKTVTQSIESRVQPKSSSLTSGKEENMPLSQMAPTATPKLASAERKHDVPLATTVSITEAVSPGNSNAQGSPNEQRKRHTLDDAEKNSKPSQLQSTSTISVSSASGAKQIEVVASSETDKDISEHLPILPDFEVEEVKKRSEDKERLKQQQPPRESKARSKKLRRAKEIEPPPPPPPPTVPSSLSSAPPSTEEEKKLSSNDQSSISKPSLDNLKTFTKPILTTADLLNKRRQLRKVDRQAEFDPVTLSRKRLLDDIYEQRNVDPPDYIPLAHTSRVIITTNISADLTNMQLSGLELVTDMTFGLLHGDRVTPVKKFLNLKKLHIMGCFNITDQGIKWMAEAFPELNFIEMHGCTSVTERGFHYLFEGCSSLHVCLAMSNNAAVIPDSICDTMISKGSITWAGSPVISQGKNYYSSRGAEEHDFYDPKRRKVVIFRDSSLPNQVTSLLKGKASHTPPAVFDVALGVDVPSLEKPDYTFTFNILEMAMDLPSADTFVTEGAIIMLAFETPAGDGEMREVAQRLAERICSVIIQSPDVLFLLVDTGSDESGNIFNLITGILTDIKNCLHNNSYASFQSSSSLDCLDFKGQKFVGWGMAATDNLVQLLHPDYIGNRLIYQHGSKESFQSWIMPLLSKSADIVQVVAPYVHSDFQVSVKEFLTQVPLYGITTHSCIFKDTDQSARQRSIKRFSFPRAGSMLKFLSNWGEGIYLPSDKESMCSTNLPQYKSVYDLMITQTPPATVWVDCYRGNVPCWTKDSLKTALRKQRMKLNATDCIRMFKRQGMLLCLEPQMYQGEGGVSLGSVAVRWKDVPEKHEILESLWPSKRPKVRAIQCNRMYTLLPSAPSGFMPKLLRTLLKVYRPLLVWKTGFLLRQGVVDIKGELYKNSERNTVFLLSARIIQLDMDAKFDDISDWRRSTDNIRNIMFGSVRQVVLFVDYACFKSKVFAYTTFPCPKCAEFTTEGILDMSKTWHREYYHGLSIKSKACPRHKMVDWHFLAKYSEEQSGDGIVVPRHNYPYHVALQSYLHDMVKGTRYRAMDAPEKCFYCSRDAVVPCYHCSMCSFCAMQFAKFAKTLEPGGINSKSFKLSFGTADDEKETERIKSNTKGCVFYYRKGSRKLLHYSMSPFYFDQLTLILLKDTHCTLNFTLETGEQMSFHSRSGTFVKKSGSEYMDEMLKMRDANSFVIKLNCVELGRRVRLNLFVRGKLAYSEEVDGWDIKLDVIPLKAGLYIIKAPGIKRSWQQREVENFAVGSTLECATEDGKVHAAKITDRDPSGYLTLSVNGGEIRLVTSSPQLYPIGTTAAKGGTLASIITEDLPHVPTKAFLKFQVPCGWKALLRQGLGSNLPTEPQAFLAFYNKDPFLTAFITPCCALDSPSVMHARQVLLNDPLENLLYNAGKHNFSLCSVLLLPSLMKTEDFMICSQRICIKKFKLHPLCYYRADTNSTMVVNPTARLGREVECRHSLHMLDNEGYELAELQDPDKGMVGMVVLWAWIRMLLRLQRQNRQCLSQYSAITKGIDGISHLSSMQIHNSLMSMISMIGDALFLSMDFATNVLERLDEGAVQRWMDINELHAEQQGLTRIQLKFMDDQILMCDCHKEMWAINDGLTSYKIPTGIYLPFMLSLNLGGNALEVIPPEVFTCMPNLMDFASNNNKLRSIPKEICHCRKLNTVTLSSNLLTSLPDSMVECREIRRLDIDKNQFTEFPLVVTRLRNLGRLYAQHLHLETLPDSIGKLTELATLSLNGNCFTDLPEGFGNLQKLTSLSMNGVMWLKSRHHVLLSREHFEEFLTDNNLQHWLEKRNQDKQSIFSLFDEDTNGTLDPKEIGKLNATMFYVFPRFGYRGRRTPDEDTPNGFPKVLLRLKSLEYLSLQYQGLVSLPEEIFKMSSLNNLHLGNNPNLLTIPAQLGGLNLKRLELDGCPLLKTPPKEIRARGFVTTFAYLKRLLSGSVSCKRTKLMLVGLGGAGKTSLVKALLNPKKKTELTIGEEITDGIDICPWTVATPDGDEITYSVWDFAGQTVYYNTHQFFLSDRAVYFLLWNIRLGYEHAGLDFWLNSIRVHAPKAPIFVVGTHLDQVSKVEIPIKEMRTKFPQISAFHFVSSHTGKGVEELQEEMIEVTLRQRYMGEKIPGVWLTFEDNLKSIKDRNVIEFRELEKRASRSGIFEASEIIQAVQFLHELGSIQYFTNANLKSHVVINPQWIVDMMACVVSVKDSPIKSGKFKHCDMHQVWKDYEPSLHTWMLKLTEEFDLTFQLKDLAINLVPCLLPEKKPEFEWPESDKGGYSRETKMIYSFDYLPAGLFNRSQVRLHEFSDSSLIWKRGSFLKKNKHICLLYQSRDCELTVKAMGPSPDNFLFLVHEVFETLIMESFRGISYDFSVPCPDCLKLSLKDPHMFPASIVRRATELKAPFLQCIKYFHTISITDIHASMPPDSNQDFDLHLVQAVRGMKELQHDLAADVFVSYCPADDKTPAANNVPLGQICADVERLGYKCWVPRNSSPQSLDEMAKALLDAKIFMVFMSNRYVKDDTCCNLFKYARLTLRKPIVLIATGDDLSWKQSNMGILMADEVFINMMNIERYANKFDELKGMLREKYSPTKVPKTRIAHPCFVSYCWQNSAQAVAKGSRTSDGAVGYGDPRAIKDFLDAKGIRCWIDVERVGVHGLFEDIGEGLLKSRVVVVCMSDQYAASDNCSIEFRYAANTLKLPIILAVVGTGNKWRASELGIMSLNHPLVSFQEGSQSSMGKILELVNQHMADTDAVDKADNKTDAAAKKEKKDKDAMNVSLKEKQQLSLQEICELAQRKFLRQVNQYTDSEQSASYPALMMVDFLLEEKGESEALTSEDENGKKKSPDTASVTSTSTEKQTTASTSTPTPTPAASSAAKSITHHTDFHDQTYGVHLLCEHEEGWHKSGDVIPLDKEFGHSLERYLPYVGRVTAIARYSRKLPLNCVALKTGHKYLTWMEENPIVTLATDFHESFHDLRTLVMSTDRQMQMGGLQRCLLPSGKHVWLCPKHRQTMRVTVLTKESVANIQSTAQSVAVDQMVVAMRDISVDFLPAKFRQDEEEEKTKSSQSSRATSAKLESSVDNAMNIDPEMTHNLAHPAMVTSQPLPVRNDSKQDSKQQKQQQQQQATTSSPTKRPLSRANSKSRACLLM